MRRHFGGLTLRCLMAAMLVGSVCSSSLGETRPNVQFNRDIRPLLADNCLACHGPDKNKRKAGLRLDRSLEATARLESGSRAVVPGDLRQSRILHVLTTEDEAERMPPKKTGKRLSPEQVRLLETWISEGARFEEHWAYLPPVRPPLPEVSNPQWPRNDIDHFILARLDREGLAPSPEAPKATLLRRATLDLTGLPPTLEEVDAFMADTSSGAYETLIDRLLASPAYGERMAQHWLDLARYADSDGYHADIPRSMWQYRDYVIDAFRSNKPFDQFTIEQLAGDLLPKPTLEQRIATAFNRNGMSSTEGGADPDEYMNKYVTDRVNTFGTVYLGSSIACTECHDHKYDPLTQREYYQLYDFFNRIPERGLDADPAPPFVKVPTPAQAAEFSALTNEVATLDSQRLALLAKPDPEIDAAESRYFEGLQSRIAGAWAPLLPTAASSGKGAHLATLEDHSILASGTTPDQDTYDIVAQVPETNLTALRLEALVDPSLPGSRASRATNGPFILTAIEAEAESANPSREPAPSEDIAWGDWSALGPFSAANPKEAFEKAFINEAAPDLQRTFEEGRLRWTARPSTTDGTAQPLSGENQVSYFHRVIRVPRERAIQIRAGSDGGFQLWLNGTRVQNGRTFRRVAAAPEEITLRLKPGENTVLVKVHHGSGEYGFLFGRPTAPVTRLPLEFAGAFADASDGNHPPGSAIDAKPETGWSPGNADAWQPSNHTLVLLLKDPPRFAGGTLYRVRLKFEAGAPRRLLGRFRLSTTATGGLDEWASLPRAIQEPLFGRREFWSKETRDALRDHYRSQHVPELKSLATSLAAKRKAAADLDGRIPTIRVMEDSGPPRLTQIRVRGDYRTKGDAVTANVPAILPALQAGIPTNRLALARWLTAPNHPLTARVTVNRFWALHFGTGLVKTGNEFGSQGELPSHPELLDWLAREFIDGGWNVKALQKRILMSATYRQSSKVTPDRLAADPANRLLSRAPRLRLPAEQVRDCALDYAGLLDRKRALGGPSVRPYQPAGLWEEKMFGGNKYEESSGADLYRRSLYTLWKRTVLNPTLMTFDAPDRAICTEQRSTTCTPLQAFVTLNEKGFVEAARVFAARILREGGDTVASRIAFAFRTVLARPPSPREEAILATIHEDMHAAYQRDLKGAVDLLGTGATPRAENLNELDLVAWTATANAILNLDETITRE